MRCLFCPSLIRYPFLFERSHSSGNYVRMTRAPSGEYNSPRKVLLSTSAFISLGVVMAASVEFCSNRLLTASVSNGGPLSCVPALVFSAVNSVSKTKKSPRFSLSLSPLSSLPAISGRTKPKVFLLRMDVHRREVQRGVQILLGFL